MARGPATARDDVGIEQREPGAILLAPTSCAICGTPGNSDEIYGPRLSPDAFTSSVFSARRLPDGVHYRMVRCRGCGLVRSDPVVGAESLASLYRASTFDYGDELAGLRVTYGATLDRIARLLTAPTGLLDIGTGSGFVLELAINRGWSEVRGVEPSTDAIARARADIRPRIVADVMAPGLFPAGSFSAVTMFQVLDHMPDPIGLLRECHAILRPGGIAMAFNHDVSAWSARLLGERSPIIDVEHTYLYSPVTIQALFERAGFEVLSVAPVRNTYSLPYLAHLVPLPAALKPRVVARLRRSRVGAWQLNVPLGNLRLIARRRG
jgi:SAM-dependent methyltransferase